MLRAEVGKGKLQAAKEGLEGDQEIEVAQGGMGDIPMEGEGGGSFEGNTEFVGFVGMYGGSEEEEKEEGSENVDEASESESDGEEESGSGGESEDYRSEDEAAGESGSGGEGNRFAHQGEVEGEGIDQEMSGKSLTPPSSPLRVREIGTSEADEDEVLDVV